MTHTPRFSEGRLEEPGVPGNPYTTPTADPEWQSLTNAERTWVVPTDAPVATPMSSPREPDVGDPAQRDDAGPSPHARGREPRSIGEIASDLFKDASTLVHQEVELAKAEARQSAAKAGRGAGLLVGAGIAAGFGVLFASLALWWALATRIGTTTRPALGWSGLIIAVIYAIAAISVAASGRGELKKVRGIPQTTETVSKIPNAVTGNEEMNR